MKENLADPHAHVHNPRIEVLWFEMGADDLLSKVEVPPEVRPEEIEKFTASEGELTEVIAKNGSTLFGVDLKLKSADPKGTGGCDIIWEGPGKRKWLCELKAAWVAAPVVGQAMGYLFEHMPRDGKPVGHYHVLAGGFRVNHQACALADHLSSTGVSIMLFELAGAKGRKDLLRLRRFTFDGKGLRAEFKSGMVLFDAVNVHWAGHTGYLEIRGVSPKGECEIQVVREKKAGDRVFEPVHEIKMSSTLVHLEVVSRAK